MLRVLRNLLLTAIAFGLIVASMSQHEQFLAHVELACGVGAFSLAWLLPNP